MKFGVREICDVVLRAKANQKIGNKIFYKGEPVIYFDTLKTSSMEGAATTVYAQGGRGNSRLVAWEGERTITYTMEDALISPVGFMILSGAGLVEATEDNDITLNVHVAEQTDKVYIESDVVYVITEQKVSTDANAGIYVMIMDGDEVSTEPFIGVVVENATNLDEKFANAQSAGKLVEIKTRNGYSANDLAMFVNTKEKNGDIVVMVDYYTPKSSGAQQIEITADKFGGNYYLEASTLFRDQNGVDMPAEFIIPNCKIQSNFTFTMASSGDPSTFTFTMDAFPDYTRFDRTKKVLAAIQIINEASTSELTRESTNASHTHEYDEASGAIVDKNKEAVTYTNIYVAGPTEVNEKTTAQFAAITVPAGGPVTFAIENGADVASIDLAGNFTAKDVDADTTVTVTAATNGYTKDFTVTIKPVAEG